MGTNRTSHFLTDHRFVCTLTCLCEALASFANKKSANTRAGSSAQSLSLWRALRCHLSHGTTWSQFEFCENLWCWQCDETALYLRVRTLCRRFCRFIEPLLQSWPLGPFISYRTFYLRFMEHAIRPDIPTVAQYWDLTNNLVLFFEQLMSQKENITSTFVSGKGST